MFTNSEIFKVNSNSIQIKASTALCNTIVTRVFESKKANILESLDLASLVRLLCYCRLFEKYHQDHGVNQPSGQRPLKNGSQSAFKLTLV